MYIHCRSWLFPCGHGVWTCTTELAYWEPGCPSVYPQTTAPPPGDCRMVGGACQFTNTTLECTTRLNSCQGYQCVSASDVTESPGCAFGGQYPQPDELCLPINGTCQWYDPCVSWPGFCQSGYRCGSIDQYYQFMFGPQPICVPRPPNWVRPPPPGECTVTNGQCQWNSKWLIWDQLCRCYYSHKTLYICTCAGYLALVMVGIKYCPTTCGVCHKVYYVYIPGRPDCYGLSQTSVIHYPLSCTMINLHNLRV